MPIRTIAIAALLFTLPLQASQPAPARLTALRAARVLDPVSGRVTSSPPSWATTSTISATAPT